MTGGSHRIIGTMTGAVVAVYGITQLNIPMMGLVMVTAPFGAMLPDIDHDHSKLGSQRKAVVDTAKPIIMILGAIASLAYVAYAVYKDELEKAIIFALILIGILILIKAAFSSKFLRENIQWAAKHRGIMHTNVVPALIAAAVYFSYFNELISMLLIGLGVGFISHIAIADGNTKRGSPLLWPLTKHNFKLLRITTGSPAEIIFVIFYCLATGALIGYFAGAF